MTIPYIAQQIHKAIGGCYSRVSDEPRATRYSLVAAYAMSVPDIATGHLAVKGHRGTLHTLCQYRTSHSERVGTHSVRYVSTRHRTANA
eukprot:203367-Rhodomonas_salina.6